MGRQRRSWRHLLLATALIMGASACALDFDDVALVKDMRFLGIEADPPEQILWRDMASIPPDVGAWLLGAMAKGGGIEAICGEAVSPPKAISGIRPVRISALMADPRIPAAERGKRTVRWEVWACAGAASSCSATSGFSTKLASRITPLTQIAYDFVPSGELFFHALCEDPFSGFGGLPIIVELRVFDAESGLWIHGVKRVVYTFWLPYSPVPAGKRANHNPALERILLTIEDADDKEVRHLDLADLGGSTLELRRERHLKIEPAVTEASKEDFLQVSIAGGAAKGGGAGGPGIEILALEECDKGEKRSTDPSVSCGSFFSWQFYATGGALSHAATGGAPALFAEDKKVRDPSTTWTPPELVEGEARPGDETTLWIVGDDGRGGVVWRTLVVKVKDVP